MKTLLRIDASIRLNGSSTRALTHHFEERWRAANPDGEVIHRCLATAPIPHLTQPEFEAFGRPIDASTDLLSNSLIRELQSADHILIGSPLYNLTLPSSLKAYFDHVVRSGETFEFHPGGYRGLLQGKRATLITVRAGQQSPTQVEDFQTDYLKNILAFIGITDVDVIALEGLADPASKSRALEEGRRLLDHRFELQQEPHWIGDFSVQDRQALTLLRTGQADAIVAGDQAAYAALCADDIQLLIPGKDLVAGIDAFVAAEKALFSSARFTAFRKFPARVERSGNLAIETGRQEISLHGTGNNRQGAFSAHQKYTHVFRLTEQGWRFAILMSNPSE
jgi:FMN-dependent NADH-azoreductase